MYEIVFEKFFWNKCVRLKVKLFAWKYLLQRIPSKPSKLRLYLCYAKIHTSCLMSWLLSSVSFIIVYLILIHVMEWSNWSCSFMHVSITLFCVRMQSWSNNSRDKPHSQMMNLFSIIASWKTCFSRVRLSLFAQLHHVSVLF